MSGNIFRGVPENRLFFYKRIGFIFVLGLSFGCKESVLVVKDSFFCDQFSEKSGCVLSYKDSYTYHPDVPKVKQGSWFDLAYHLYFRTRETPGLRVEFNRRLSFDERTLIQKEGVCEVELKSKDQITSFNMEGFRVDDRGIWCFDYLGTMLIHLQKSQNRIYDPPNRSIFPLDIKIAFRSPYHLQSVKSAKINIDWKDSLHLDKK